MEDVAGLVCIVCNTGLLSLKIMMGGERCVQQSFLCVKKLYYVPKGSPFYFNM